MSVLTAGHLTYKAAPVLYSTVGMCVCVRVCALATVQHFLVCVLGGAVAFLMRFVTIPCLLGAPPQGTVTSFVCDCLPFPEHSFGKHRGLF